MYSLVIVVIALLQASNAFMLASPSHVTKQANAYHRHADLKSSRSVKTALVASISPILLEKAAVDQKTRAIRDIDEEPQDSDSFDMWELRLLNDSRNTKGYVARSLVQVIGLYEDDAYYTMRKAHEKGVALIGVFCREFAEHYRDSLARNGVDCKLFPVEN